MGEREFSHGGEGENSTPQNAIKKKILVRHQISENKSSMAHGAGRAQILLYKEEEEEKSVIFGPLNNPDLWFPWPPPFLQSPFYNR